MQKHIPTKYPPLTPSKLVLSTCQTNMPIFCNKQAGKVLRNSHLKVGGITITIFFMEYSTSKQAHIYIYVI